ncbi:MAG TPA: hypothetical protein VFX79_00780 [Candidatus Saccharimonadales bacterium]|nr:hypothetical protein [Candidatus Saccharimonadales bacterium]
MLTEASLGAKIEAGLPPEVEQDYAYRQEAERAGALDELATLEKLEDLGYRVSRAVDGPPQSAEPEEEGLSPDDEKLFDGGQFTPAMLRSSRH